MIPLDRHTVEVLKKKTPHQPQLFIVFFSIVAAVAVMRELALSPPVTSTSPAVMIYHLLRALAASVVAIVLVQPSHHFAVP